MGGGENHQSEQHSASSNSQLLSVAGSGTGSGGSSPSGNTGTSSSTSASGGAWPNKKSDYTLHDAIGVGATATVYKVRLDSIIGFHRHQTIVIRVAGDVQTEERDVRDKVHQLGEVPDLG